MRRWWPRSLAGQAIALQILVIAVVVLAGSGLALVDARQDGDAAARQQVVSIATALADSPSTAAGDRIRQSHRDSAAGHRGGPHQHRHRLHHDHVARRHPVHPHRSAADRRALPRHHRARAARRDVHRGVHRHARAVHPRHRAGARRLRAGSSAWCRRASRSRRWRNAGAITVADDRRGQRWGAGDFVGRRVGDPAQAAAPDARTATRRAAGDVRTSRRDPAFGVRGADRARPRRRGAGQRRGPPPARPAAGPVSASDLPEFLRTYDPGARDEVHVTDDRVLVVNRSQVDAPTRHRLGGRHHPRPHRIARAHWANSARCRC